MRLWFSAAALAIFASSAPAAPLVKDGKFDACATLPACMQILEHTRPAVYRLREWSDLDAIAVHLQSFGPAATKEILARASGDDSGWKDLAGELLWHWKGLTDADIPALQSAIHTREGEHIAWALASIGTPAAKRALVDQVVKGMLGADEPLARMGAGALPYLFEGLKNPGWLEATYVIQLIDDADHIPLGPWLNIALDNTRAVDDRVAALRGLSALQGVPDSVRDSLLPLTSEADPALQAAAVNAIVVLKGIAPVGPLVRACPLRSDRNTSLADRAWDGCREQIASHNEPARPYGDVLAARFLSAPNGLDRADGATMLGFIGYAPAIPDLIARLEDRDWRVVMASARALGWLGAKDAAPALDHVAEAHWFPDVRNYARAVAVTLRSPEGRIARPSQMTAQFEPDDKAAPHDAFEVGPLFLTPRHACQSGRWDWSGTRFSPLRQPRLELQDLRGLWGDGSHIPIAAQGELPGGEMIGTDIGRWGGQLYWKPTRGKSQALKDTNVLGLMPIKGGVIALFGECCRMAPREGDGPGTLFISNGPTGYGYALRVTRNEKGEWTQEEIARFPEGPVAFHAISPELFVAWSAEDAIVFDTEKILGLASCVGG